MILIHLWKLVLQTDFVDMDKEIFIETQGITHEETQASSIEGSKGKKEEDKVANK